jgi:phenylalanyl-tRNA synthetase beta chain
MIVTRSWLNEFLPLEGVDDEHLYEKFVAIGHEVARKTHFSFDPLVVVGRVISVDAHPDADKLRVCEVNVGEKLLTIVCGAPNVAAGQYVPVAQVGAKLPGGLEIKEAALRGIQSSGMICSSTELGLPATGEGIMVLDRSVGDLTPGWQLNNYPQLADTFFELELTANRGDCLSIYGIARDLSAALDITLYPAQPDLYDQSAKGIGRVLQLISAPGASAAISIKAIENNGFDLPVVVRLRLGWLEYETKEAIDALCEYATHTSGVLFRAYDIKAFCHDPGERGVVRLSKEGAFNVLSGREPVGRIGLDMNATYRANDSSELIVLQAFFVDPDEISKAAWGASEAGDALHNRACKGSEPQLDRGMRFFYDLLNLCGKSRFYAEALTYEPDWPERSIAINTDTICALIGQPFEKNQIITLLKRLGAKAYASGDQNSFMLAPPRWRHDIQNSADVAEEVVRILGIDQIEAQPLALPEVRGVTEGWQRFRHERNLAYRAVSQGYFESVHFLFCDSRAAARFGFGPLEASLALANPITAELDALRPSLLINLVAAAAQNRARGRERAPLFEIGDTYDAKRQHTRAISFVLSGPMEPASINNHGKPPAATLGDFVRQVAAVVGDFDLKQSASVPAYLQPGQCAQVLRSGEVIGTLGKLHPALAQSYDLETTWVASFDLAKLLPCAPQAKPVSRLQPLRRDISLLLDADQTFGAIKAAIDAAEITHLKALKAIDRYHDETLGDRVSLTLRLLIQPEGAKSLTDEQIACVVDRVCALLQERFNGELR